MDTPSGKITLQGKEDAFYTLQKAPGASSGSVKPIKYNNEWMNMKGVENVTLKEKSLLSLLVPVQTQSVL